MTRHKAKTWGRYARSPAPRPVIVTIPAASRHCKTVGSEARLCKQSRHWYSKCIGQPRERGQPRVRRADRVLAA